MMPSASPCSRCFCRFSLLGVNSRVRSPSERTSWLTQRRAAYSSSRRVPDFAFAFDIDGVLLRGDAALPRAAESLQYLRDQQVPFVLLTNGGGYHETRRAEKLSHELAIRISHEEVIQSHTPFAAMQEYKDKTVLVVGGELEHSRQAAMKYGFKNVVIPSDIFLQNEGIWPFSRPLREYHIQGGKQHAASGQNIKIDAIFVFNDPRDWGLDLALIVDCLLSRKGILGTLSDKNGDSELPNKGYQQDSQPPLYFSNPDIWWSGAYDLPRLGQGGFQAALNGVWNTITGGTANGVELQRITLGKPTQFTYEFAEDKLVQLRASQLGTEVSRDVTLKSVYMIGDNPASDIQGANSYKSSRGIKWCSALVETGVYKSGSTPAHRPTNFAKDVFEAVQWGLQTSSWPNSP